MYLFELALSFALCIVASQDAEALDAECASESKLTRLDCIPEKNANQEWCIHRGCCWSERKDDDFGVPECYFPSDYPAHKVVSVTQTSTGYFVNLTKPSTGYGINEFQNVLLEVRYETKTRLRLRFTIPSQPDRWEPPIPLEAADDPPPQMTDYGVELDKSPFGLRVVRSGLKRDILLDSSGALSAATILAHQFLQITFRLNVHRAFGPGETRLPFPHPLNLWQRVGLWARDTPPIDGANLYGVHNFFMGLSHDGTAFGVFLLNSNAQEVAFTPLPSITYRVIGGILDFFVFTGPQPSNVIAQYYDLIGHPPVPPYWSLGFHLCRYGYSNLTEVSETLARNLLAQIPIEVQWLDIDYMDELKSWSVDLVKFANLGNFIKDTLHDKHQMKSVLIVDPAMSTTGGSHYMPYTTGLDLGIFINDSRTGQPITGTVWPGETVFPDFSHPNAEQWWFDLANQFHLIAPFDGLWIDMNEPANFNEGSLVGCDADNPLDNPVFVPMILDRLLYAKTLCPSAKHHDTTHYYRHNLYGYDEAATTYRMMMRLFPGKRPFILSRSTFAGSGRYTIHWTGDNLSSWADMRTSIAQVINFNMYGIPMVGADICGFRDNATEELCVRWSQLGAFYPFSRNHNSLGSIPQDPASWSPEAVEAIRDVLNFRYLLLPYLYTLFYRAHLFGESVVRALAFEFPLELGSHSVDTQFMLGSCLLINPVLEEGRTEVDGYVPSGDWINLSTGQREHSYGEMMHFKAPLHVIPILLRAGCVLPIQTSPGVTSVSRKKGLSLFAVLSNQDDGSDRAGVEAEANGELFWDDGESHPLDYVHVTFTVRNRSLHVTSFALQESTVDRLDPRETVLNLILITGFTLSPTSVLVNGQPVEFRYDLDLQTLRIKCPEATNFTSQLLATWRFG
ncbi:unnamed protein product [Dicrocoelium dendriticum]|nr:unnamed protein product [Dicrocoelium dendriticum]